LLRHLDHVPTEIPRVNANSEQFTSPLCNSLNVKAFPEVSHPGVEMCITKWPNTIGNEGVFEDVGFHAIGNQFHGPMNRLNVFPGSGRSIAVSDGEVMKNLNLSRYKVDFENPVANLIHKTGQPVPIRFEIIYNKSNMTSRPDAFKASYQQADGN
ncbi:hypothetical protein, partial [Massilia aquatica]|uniref:hypothetical protein n=1 Tax=Massilia aquatica TaxID=2609000 RepID=UPI001A7EBDEF